MIDSYSLDLDVDFKRAVIRGSVTIHAVGVKAPFELNAKEMTVKGVSADGGKDVPFKHDAKNGLLRLTRLPRSREVDIVISYEKRVPDEASTGVYKARYGTDYFLTTDFEPDRARTFFPCKDEPTWKSVFNLSVVTDAGLKVISNASLKETSDVKGGKKARFVFEPTPRMSTYLFYMGVGRFSEASRAPRSKQGPEVIVASRAGTSGKCEFILELASSVVDESGKYFGVKYPLKKLHLVAIPEMGGAMENWGAITSFEGGLLVDDSASELDRRGAALVTAHEIQHQWFGDLVTMKWWDDIWLNESFATFMSYKIVDRLHPEWDCWSDFLGTAVLGRWGWTNSMRPTRSRQE